MGRGRAMSKYVKLLGIVTSLMVGPVRAELALVEDTLVEEAELIDQISGVTEKPSVSVEPVGETKPTAKAKKPKPVKKEVKEV